MLMAQYSAEKAVCTLFFSFPVEHFIIFPPGLPGRPDLPVQLARPGLPGLPVLLVRLGLLAHRG